MAATQSLNYHLPLLGERADLGQRLQRFAVIVFMPISIVAPVVRLNEDFWVKIEFFLLPLVALVYLWLLLAGLARPIRPNILFIVAPIMCICVVLSLLYGTEILGHPLLGRDFFELPKTIIPVLFFTLAYEADLSEASLRTLLIGLIPAIIVICIYGYGQWFDMGFTRALQPLYTGGLHDDGALAHYRRVYSTQSNPNHLGMLMTWMIVTLSLGALLRIGSRFWNLLLLPASIVTLAMTGSRYGLLSASFAMILLFLMPSSTKTSGTKRRKILIATLPVLATIFLTVVFSNRATLDRVQMLGTPLQEGSVRLRLDILWAQASSQFLESPIFGHGPAKAIFSDIWTDSEYLVILKQFGLLGLAPYLCYFLVPLWIVWKGVRRVPSAGGVLEREWPATYWALSVSFIMIVTVMVMNIGMDAYYNYSILAYLWMWMGIGASCARRVQAISSFSAVCRL
jgi:O-antigen ligase